MLCPLYALCLLSGPEHHEKSVPVERGGFGPHTTERKAVLVLPARDQGQLCLWSSAFLANTYLHCESAVRTGLKSVPLRSLAGGRQPLRMPLAHSFLPSLPVPMGALSPDTLSPCVVLCPSQRGASSGRVTWNVPCRWGLATGPPPSPHYSSLCPHLPACSLHAHFLLVHLPSFLPETSTPLSSPSAPPSFPAPCPLPMWTGILLEGGGAHA